jgi:putative ABC transport system permease protein
MLHSVRQQIASIDPDQQAAGDTRDLEGWIEREPEYIRARLVSMLFGAFSVLALVLAAVGLYSVVSYTVLQRTGQLGVRIALGAQRRDMLRIVGVSAGTSVGLGVLSGLVLSFALDRLIAQWIENATQDPAVILGVSLLLLLIAAIACLVPARRALAINPIAALRCE